MMSEVFDWLLQSDKRIFLWINHDWGNPVFDLVFPNITDLHKNPWFAFPALISIFLLLVWKRKKWGALIFFELAITMAMADAIGNLIKHQVNRSRPPLSGIDVILRSPQYGGPSFPSNHASNLFCFAMFVSFFFPKTRWPLLAIALLVAISRVYVGVHFPSDVIVGAIWGAGFGFMMAKIASIGVHV